METYFQAVNLDIPLSDIYGEEWRGITAQIRAELYLPTSQNGTGKCTVGADVLEFAQIVLPDGSTLNHTGKDKIRQDVTNYVEANPTQLMEGEEL